MQNPYEGEKPKIINRGEEHRYAENEKNSQSSKPITITKTPCQAKEL